ncbi:MAG: TonB-dependent receptor plug domain-containing protein, partial [Gammaproteobacteria bacterium]
MSKSGGLSLVLQFLAGFAFAGEEYESGDYEAYFVNDAPIVLSATRLAQPLSDVPVAMTVIDRKMIEASGAKEIVELMRLVPGMQIGYRRGHFPSVTYHGMADEFSKGMQVLVDGQSVYLASFGGVPWADLPVMVEDIERIEVTRGPNAATYGPNSFMGVINIITTHSAQDQGLKTGFRGGSRDYRRGMARYGGGFENMNYRIGLLHQEDDGFAGQVDDQRTEILSSRFDWQLTPKDSVMLDFGYNEGKKQLGFSGSMSDPLRYEKHFTISQQLRWEHQIDPFQSVSAHLAHNQQRVDDDFFSDGRGLSNDQLAERVDFELQHAFVPFADARLVWGIGSRLDRMRMPFWVGDDDDRTNIAYRTFGNLEWYLWNKFTVNFGALFEYNSFAGADVSPRLALNYHFSGQQTFRFAVSRTSRMPALGEEHLDIRNTIPTLITTRALSTHDLEPETAVTFEIGHHGSFFDNKLVTDMKFSRQKYRDLVNIPGIFIDPVTFEPVLRYDNHSSATSLNYELQLDYLPTRSTLLHFGYSWLKISSSANRFQFNYQDSAPEHTVNILASQKLFDGWQASVGYYYRSDMKYLRVTDHIGHYQRVDLILQKTFRL